MNIHKATAAAERLPGAPQRILMADDEPAILQLSTQALTRSGFQVDAVEDGEAAWAALNATQYHLLITDNNMPRLSGLELLSRLNQARVVLPVIMASGNMPTVEFTRNPHLQPAATLMKPFTVIQLLEKVRVVLAVSGTHQLRPS